jgi:hypothetical protein
MAHGLLWAVGVRGPLLARWSGLLVRVDHFVAKLNRVITGWGRFFRMGEPRHVGRWLDRWILRRLRAFLANRWRAANWRRYPDVFFYRRLGLGSFREFS